MNDLAQLLKIAAFGRKIFLGNFYDVKYRYKITPQLEELLTSLKAKYNHMYIYRTQGTGFVLFGGRFHVNDTFVEEVAAGIAKKQQPVF